MEKGLNHKCSSSGIDRELNKKGVVEDESSRICSPELMTEIWIYSLRNSPRISFFPAKACIFTSLSEFNYPLSTCRLSAFQNTTTQGTGCRMLTNFFRKALKSLAENHRFALERTDCFGILGPYEKLTRSKTGQIPLPKPPCGCFAQRYLTPF